MNLDSFYSLSSNQKFSLLVVCIIILYLCTRVFDIQIGHILALLLCIGVVIIFSENNTKNTLSYNKQLLYKLNYLNTKNVKVTNFHIDSDLINLFYDIKFNFYKYNNKAYENALKCTDNLLTIRNDIEKRIDKPLIIPDLHDNNNKDNYQIKSNNKGGKNTTLNNTYENYTVAVAMYKKSIQYLKSFIYSISPDPVLQHKFDKSITASMILLKRNLDIIKLTHDKSIKERGIDSNTKFITNYDLPQPV